MATERHLGRRSGIALLVVATFSVATGLWLTRGGDPTCAPWHEGTRCGDWRLVYAGYGTADAGPGPASWRVRLRPQPAVDPAVTHAALAVSEQQVGDLDMSATMTTLEQLRHPGANPWEVAWLLWHYTDDEHYYYIALKTNGWELGKEDPAYPGAQRYLLTGSSPTFPIGRRFDTRVRQLGDEISVVVDGRPLLHVRDTEHPYTHGSVGLYTEDAAVEFDSLRIDAHPTPTAREAGP